jgi:hypothetical protein
MSKKIVYYDGGSDEDNCDNDTSNEEKKTTNSEVEAGAEPGIVLISCEKSSIFVDKKCAKLSPLLSKYIHSKLKKLELKINNDLLQKLYCYLEYYDGDVKRSVDNSSSICMPLRYLKMSENTKSEWDALYIDEIAKDVNVLKNLLNLSEIFGIEGLTTLCCARISLLVKGKPFHAAVNFLKKV